ncbi:MAG TPA: GLPGLI family protein [Chitinophagaceae bacterium]|jgi:GLPGLI family protein|nr:GLPGLI family protein [Chitinophagaceae bacterium]MBP9739940.1 GLPGLI family protein [Chitinophagaceae bacterium]HPH23740.1 GLPGLI family protein [Chitinophagaceae bacterium]
MKKLIISLLFICIFVKLFSQNTANSFGRILYTVSSQKIHRSVEMWFTSANYLYTITNSSNLQNSETLKNRKFNSIEDSLNEVQKINETNARIKDLPKQYWYGESGNKTITFSYFNYNENNKAYCVTDTIKNINWEYTNDTITIEGLLCQKALGTINGASIVAWFAPSIPISVAPFNYVGLPGLLIKLTNLKNNQVISMTELNWPLKESNLVKIEPCNKYPLITKRQFNEILDNSNKKVYKMMEDYRNGKKTNMNEFQH